MLCAVIVSQAQTKETRNVGTFTKISFRVPGKLYVRQGSPQKVVIEGPKDILKEIETDLEGDKLVIEREGKDWFWDSGDRVNVYVTVKDIDALSVGGSGDLIGETKITTNNIRLSVSGSGNMMVDVDASGNMDADVSGSGNMELKAKCTNADFGVSGSGKIEASGSASQVSASISGSGKVLAGDLETDVCEVRISGSGDVEINVKKELDANIAGSGNVRYKGNPSKVNSHSAGSGHVRKL
jgi:hypothetical protein